MIDLRNGLPQTTEIIDNAVAIRLAAADLYGRVAPVWEAGEMEAVVMSVDILKDLGVTFHSDPTGLISVDSLTRFVEWDGAEVCDE